MRISDWSSDVCSSDLAVDARAVIIATGSEVSLALDAQQALAAQGIAVRVVSMPCTEVFDQQDAAWRESVLPAGLPRVAVEAGVTSGGSEERRDGKECVCTCGSLGSPYQEQKKN